MRRDGGPVWSCSPLREMDFDEGVVRFHALCGVQSSPLITARNRASSRLYMVAR